MIQKCDNCKPHAYQDQKYGLGMRVHTTDKHGVNHCTVCHPGRLIRKARSHAMNHIPKVHG